MSVISGLDLKMRGFSIPLESRIKELQIEEWHQGHHQEFLRLYHGQRPVDLQGPHRQRTLCECNDSFVWLVFLHLLRIYFTFHLLHLSDIFSRTSVSPRSSRPSTHTTTSTTLCYMVALSLIFALSFTTSKPWTKIAAAPTL